MFSPNPAENYERFFVPSIGAPVAADLISQAALRPGERVLDVACGTGVATRLALLKVETTGSVSGLDINPGMLEVARSKTPPNRTIEWHEASAEKIPLPDASFDVVLCQLGLQFIPDKQAALREIQRVLVPGGRLALNVPGPTPPLFGVMGEALYHHIGPEAARFVEQVFSLHDEKEIENLVRGADFSDVSVQSNTKTLRLPPPKDFLWQYLHSTPLAAAIAEADEKSRGSIEQYVVSKWQEFVKDNAVMLNVRMVSVTAQK